jgi:hypothetical protein
MSVASGTNNIYSFLFADYFLALSKFLASLETYKMRYIPETGEHVIEKPTVMYGQPSAAYRKIFENTNVNWQTRLPVISFLALQFDRIKARQNPYAIYKNNYIKSDWDAHAIALSWAPQVYKITYNFSVWTNNNKSRDDLMSRIVRYFNPTLTLKHFPDPVNNPHHFIYMPFEIEDTFSDSSELEQLEEKDTRDLIRTDFIITGESVLPLETSFHKDIRSIGVDVINDKMAVGTPDGQYRWDVSEIDGEYIIEINLSERL